MGWRERLRKAAGMWRERWVQDESGSVAVTVALTGFVLVVLAGAAIDMAIYLERRTQVAAAVDSALESAVSAAYQNEASGKTPSEAGAAGVKSGKALYDANTKKLGVDVTGKDVTIDVSKKVTAGSETWVADATVDGKYVTYFMKMLGMKTLPLQVKAASSVAINKTMDYWEYFITVDVSQSMGIGTTVTDMDKMVAYDGCYFACHVGVNDRMSKLRTMGVDFRIDAVSRAVSAMISAIKTTSNGNAKAGIYRIYTDLFDGVPLTSDFTQLQSYQIDLPVWIQSGRALELKTSEGVTNFRASMATLTDLVAAPGDGSTAAKPKRAVFLITDGVHDSLPTESNIVWQSWDGLHHTGPMSPSFCADLKRKGVVVSVLYISYYIPTGKEINEVKDFKDQILPNLKACASSPNLFFNATDSGGISAALQSMLRAVMGSGNVRLTN
jgi:Flp pilus assembly protein TadG